MNSIVRSSGRFDRRLYLGASLIFLALVFWTFARTFYLKPFFGTPPLSALLHIHGAVMTDWVVLPTFAWGAFLFVAAFHLALYFTQTRAWIAFGESLLS